MYKNKRPVNLLIYRSFVSFESGAAGSRTLVQTSSKTAFYMLSFLLIVGFMPVKNQPTYFVSSLFRFCTEDLQNLSQHL